MAVWEIYKLFKDMKSYNLEINKNQYLSDIMDQLPSNTIIFKTLTGIGATHLELNSPRHSIIIEPNVPVIKGKRNNKIMGVFEGISASDILGHLYNPKIPFKKIMVTPESFHKVVDAIKSSEFDLYIDFFLLFDECDKVSKDVDYRKSIIEPMEDFFKFEQKAFISATAIEPSDPRFKSAGFTKLYIIPTFDNTIELKLICTNNVTASFKRHISQYEQEGERYCIFYNSTRGIANLISEMDIVNESTVFCSRTKGNDFKIKVATHEYFDPKHLKKYNFFTSRFFSAVDMITDDKPRIITLTDLYTAEHSMIDPSGDAPQILGRFRNGIASATAISNTKRNLPCMSQSEAESFLNGSEITYREIENLYLSATNQGAISTLKEALELVNYANYVNEDRSKNSFMYDYFFHHEKLKRNYVSYDDLINGYKNAEAGGKQYFNVEVERDKVTVSDKLLQYKNPMLTFKEKSEFIGKILEQARIGYEESIFTILNFSDVKSNLRKNDSLILEGYDLLGYDQLIRNSGSRKDLQAAVDTKMQKDARSNFKFIKELQKEFKEGDVIDQTKLLERFKNLITQHNLVLKPTISEFERFFDISPRTSHSKYPKRKVRRIIKSRFNS